MIIRVLETDAEGNLRFRQVLIMVARQNGKSVLGAIFALYGLIQMLKGAQVVGVASNVEQANIIFKRTKLVIDNSRALSKRFHTTGTRGIRSRNSSALYQVKPAKPGAVQGLPVNLGLCDELHLEQSGRIWDDLSNGQRAQPTALLIGITTAGDSTSLTLKRLYEATESGELAHFIYEGIEGAEPDDVASILQANPAIACGRIDIETVLADVRVQPEHLVVRYLHNRFVEGTQHQWMPQQQWRALPRTGIAELQQLVFGVQVARGWTHASISAARKTATGVETELVASISRPTLEGLQALCEHLMALYPDATVVADARPLNDLLTALRERGYRVRDLRNGGYLRAAENIDALMGLNQLTIDQSPLYETQLPYVVRKDMSGGYKIESNSKNQTIDAIQSLVFAAYVANTQEPNTMQLF